MTFHRMASINDHSVSHLKYSEKTFNQTDTVENHYKLIHDHNYDNVSYECYYLKDAAHLKTTREFKYRIADQTFKINVYELQNSNFNIIMYYVKEFGFILETKLGKIRKEQISFNGDFKEKEGIKTRETEIALSEEK